ncbi:MAG TPA: CHAD domain-containing protein, partial [Thermoplasmata archaeon]|nr:CHAD domain-containing protein [Thermoplasmata archaeon]
MVLAQSGPTVRPERVAREIASILEETIRAVDLVVASPHPSAESLHRLHRQMRRLRTGLALWEALLPSAERELLHPLDVRIKRLSRLVGRIRDRDIALSLLQHFDRAHADREDIVVVERFRRRVQDDARTGRELLRAFLRSERQARLLDDVAERLRSLPRSGNFQSANRAVALAHERTHDNLRRAHRKALRRPTMQRLHRLRIRIRRARQFTDLAVVLDPRHERKFSAAMVRLQKVLGDLHDLDMVLVGLDRDMQATAWAGGLKKERRRLRREV